MKPILETRRMVFQPFTPDDFDLHSDPDQAGGEAGLLTLTA